MFQLLNPIGGVRARPLLIGGSGTVEFESPAEQVGTQHVAAKVDVGESSVALLFAYEV
jgi:hypothetical protein